MKININGIHCDIDDKLKDYTNKKLKRLTSYADLINTVNITYQINKLNNTAEGHITVPGSVIHACSESQNSMHAAMDCLIDKLMKQVNKYRDKTNAHR